MKHFFAVVLLILFASCKDEKDGGHNGGAKLQNPVGESRGGSYIVTDPEGIARDWRSENDGLGKLMGLEIVNGKTEGDEAPEDFYMIVGRTEDGKTTVASLLRLVGDKFYFGDKANKDANSYVLVICKGECDEGCLPTVMKKNGKKSLVCSPCVYCQKNEKEIR